MSAVAAATVPVFGSVALGYAAARGGLLNAATGTALVRFVYWLAIPALLFRSLARAELPAAMPWSLLAAFYLPSLALFVAGAMLVTRLPGWRRKDHGAAGMAASYSNMVLLGFPLVLAACGDHATVPLFILLAAQSPLMFPLATWLLEGGANSGGRAWRALLNPVVAALLLGAGFNLSGAVLAPTFDSLFELLGRAAPGCALVALGCSLAGYRLRGRYTDVVVLVVMKNFLHPFLVWLSCTALGVTTEWRAVAVLLAAMPSGVNAFIFASRYDAAPEAVSRTIVVSTLVSALTASALLALLPC